MDQNSYSRETTGTRAISRSRKPAQSTISETNSTYSDEKILPVPMISSSKSPLVSARDSSNSSQHLYFHSRKLRKDQLEKPWKEKKDPKENWVLILPLIGLVIGFGIAGFLVYNGLSSVIHHKYCLILDDNFSNGFNTEIWTREAEVGGFGNGQFEQTTLTDENVYVENSKLIIKPTLQDSSLIYQNTVINLTADGVCSSDILSNCVSITNLTEGTIVQPVKSGRINTKVGARIKYGRVEVTAKLPAGDWLWPAIWMLPVNETYGPWPASGEIDLMESRGNNYTHDQGGNNVISSTLHWGPDMVNDAWWRSSSKRKALHTTYTKTEHKFGLEWSQKYIFTYINTVLLQVLYTNFDRPLYERGQFPLSDINVTRLIGEWSQTGHKQSPFDQEFYLIINVAVGGINGWFKDGVGGKPWVDHSPTASKDFWDARDQWYPTWTASGAGKMEISSVKMWSQCDGNENE
ncbi:Beta-1,3-glucan-binding protein [Golovinomyces cichoracearum]|uniref:Beta-1,3-glucan-binding protein n=1 Tax=Golovinomyces cichoracearum TaxID=62708 RepID=A0A420IAR8_9PEZI|nr:Beta-1,3-glucan-binding protein [Golovinomyces cichoracearum]